jgi:hypothetical protein
VAAAKFYTDEHVARAVVKGLRQRGIDVTAVVEAGLRSAGDEVQLAHAHHEGRVLATHDADFLRLHAAGAEHAGIAYGPQDMTIGDLLRSLVLIAQVLEPADMIKHVEFL